MRFFVDYDIGGKKELPLDYRGKFAYLIKSTISNSPVGFINDLSKVKPAIPIPLCFAIRFDKKPIIKDYKILVGNKIRIWVSSPSLNIATAIYNGLITNKKIQIFDMELKNPVFLYSREHDFLTNQVLLFTLSPIIIRHYQNKDLYVTPNDKEFNESLLKSFQNIWSLYNDTFLNDSGNFEVKVINFKKVVMTHYKGLVLGFTGLLSMNAETNISKFFYQCGIGYRRTNGFGFVEVSQ